MDLTKVVEDYLKEVKNRNLYLGVNGGTIPISDYEVRNIAMHCDQFEIIDETRIPGIYPKGLRLGSGDFIEWCLSGGKIGNFYFITAV